MTRTPLHTHPEEIREYARLARAQAERLAALADRLEESNRAEEEAYPSRQRRDELLAERMEEASWLPLETQRLTDLLYLLAVGDNGPTGVAKADPESRSKQAHYDRRNQARMRLAEDGVIG